MRYRNYTVTTVRTIYTFATMRYSISQFVLSQLCGTYSISQLRPLVVRIVPNIQTTLRHLSFASSHGG
jgi:hypothetical protein